MDSLDSIVDSLIENKKGMVIALVYLAQAQGFRTGVKPYTMPPGPDDEESPPVKRAVFIEFPRETIMWPFAESQAEFLDRFPQYSE